ncbi:antibiotic biosynthesis monooxygenase family protein, partial [Klebsiella aerogenes]
MSLFLTSFIFEKKEYDDDFYQLDGEIERYTQSLEGFIGMESYHDAASGRIINNYYWRDRQSMEMMMNHLQHQQAKAQGQRWIAGYQTIVA